MLQKDNNLLEKYIVALVLRDRTGLDMQNYSREKYIYWRSHLVKPLKIYLVVLNFTQGSGEKTKN